MASEGRDSKAPPGEAVETSVAGAMALGEICESAAVGAVIISDGFDSGSDEEGFHEKGFHDDFCLILEGSIAITACEGNRGLLDIWEMEENCSE
jgi:hypothetical protein